MKKKTTMKNQQSNKSEVAGMFQEVLQEVRSLEGRIKGVEEQVVFTRAHLEAKVEDSRVDAREQLQSFQKGVGQQFQQVNKRIEGLESEMKTTQMAVRANKEELISTREELKHEIRSIGTRVEDHEERITSLEVTS